MTTLKWNRRTSSVKGRTAGLALSMAAGVLCPAPSLWALDLSPPYVQFSDPHSAVVHWQTDLPGDAIVEYGPTAALGERVSRSTPETSHALILTDLQWRTAYSYRIGYTDGGSEQFSPVYTFDNAINFSVVPCADAVSPYPVDALTPVYEAAADQILATTGVRAGYCLVYGCGEGRLAFELARRSRLVIVGVDDDEARIHQAASRLMAAGVYGSRVKVRYVPDLATLPFSKHFANLIVSDRAIGDGALAGTATEMFRVLRPSGGHAYLGRPPAGNPALTASTLTDWLQAGALAHSLTDDGAGLWASTVRDPLPGTGWWSHQYGGPENNGSSGDSLEGATRVDQTQVQWLGRPGEDAGIDRQVRMPAPIACNGRLFHQGLNRVMAMDAYNGAMLWSLEIPHLRRVNLPRDAGNACADDQSLYLAVRNECWRLDGDTGAQQTVHRVGQAGYDWGCVFRSGDKLYGSAVRSGGHFSRYWGGAYWYDATSGALTDKVCSDYLFAQDPATGERRWTYQNGRIIESTICLGGGRLYFVECRHPTVLASTRGRIGLAELWQQQYLVALDADTGAPLWEQPINTADGIVVFYLMYAGNDSLVLGSSGTSYYLYNYNAATGGFNWSANHGWYNNNHGGHMQRPVVVGNQVFMVPKLFNLVTGAVEREGMGSSRSGCPTYSASAGALLYRGSGGNTSMQDLATGQLTQWSRLRPSCWLNFVPAGGMVLNPEGAGGCSCNGWMNTSLGFAAREGL